MMRYRIESKINDGKNEAPPVEVEVRDVNELLDNIGRHATNDYDELFGVGATIEITRLA